MDSLLEIDGATGGGQVLRTALSLSMITGRPFRITGIRGKRSRPGLLRQHLTAVQAAARITGAAITGAELNATTLEFRPGQVAGGEYSFAIGTAGSTTLVLQTLIPALLTANAPSTLRVSGGTHNPAAPPFEFIERAWLPLLQRMGAQVEVNLLRHGFAPAGGGVLEARIRPSTLLPLTLDRRTGPVHTRASALVSATPASVASRELDRLAIRLQLDRRDMVIRDVGDGCGPGQVLFVEGDHGAVTEVFSGIGHGRPKAGQVADEVAEHYLRWLNSGAAVGDQLADQLLLPMALAGGGQMTTDRVSGHLQSNAQVIQQFLPVEIGLRESAERIRVSVGPAP